MKKISFLVLILPFLFFSCEKKTINTTANIQLSQKQALIINNGNVFGFDIFKKIDSSDQGKNLFISPLSISMALGMALNGAAGNTRVAMQNTLKLNGMTTADINETYKSMIDYLQSVDPKVVFSIANSIWYRNTFAVLPGFLSTNQEYFYATVAPLDFSDATGSMNIINNWVSSKTNGKITGIIDQINSNDIMYLINAIYFKGAWKYEFDKNKTSSQTFYLSDGTTKQTPMMDQKGKFNYFSDNKMQLIELPYGNSRYNMYVLLPAENNNVENLISSLNAATWEGWLDSLAVINDIEIILPKFKFDYEKSLNDILTSMGMGIAFTDLADFTGINSGGNLLISNVKHKSYIDVDEEGTEAAAVTSVTIGVSCAPPGFYANKPFLFVIAEKETKSVVFIGKVTDPAD